MKYIGSGSFRKARRNEFPHMVNDYSTCGYVVASMVCEVASPRVSIPVYVPSEMMDYGTDDEVRRGYADANAANWSVDTKVRMAGFIPHREDEVYFIVGGEVWLATRGEIDAVGFDDILTVIQAASLKRKADAARTVERARVLVASGSSGGGGYERKAIPNDVKMFVWQRDGGRCQECSDNRDLEFDHIIPVSMGGSNTARNLQLLCQPCNRSKGGNL